MSILFVQIVSVFLPGGHLRAGFCDRGEFCGFPIIDRAEDFQCVGLPSPHGMGLGHVQLVCVSPSPNHYRGGTTPQFHGHADGLSCFGNPHAASRCCPIKFQTGFWNYSSGNCGMGHGQIEQDSTKHGYASKLFFSHTYHLLSFLSIYITGKGADLGH